MKSSRQKTRKTMSNLTGPFAKSFLISLLGFGIYGAATQFLQNTRHVKNSTYVLKQWAQTLKQPTHDEWYAARDSLLAKARDYVQWQNRSHLHSGMLINRNLSGEILDKCDSLLFSSLRYVALNKMGFYYDAQTAWEAIETSQDEGFWFRHPLCAHNATSKDMMFGLFAALSQKPPRFADHLSNLMNLISNTGGFFSHGPAYLSFMTPTAAHLFKKLSRTADIPYGEMPSLIRQSYSTTEFSMQFIDGGYRSHLIALALWTELEIDDAPGRWSRHTQVYEFQRRNWISSKILDMNPQNMFYRWLRLKTSRSLNAATRYQMMRDLLAMEQQFPNESLPKDCDRRANYLWQRIGSEQSGTSKCTREYNGTDFLWMAALLLDDSDNTLSLSH